MRAWQAKPGFLVDRGPAREALISSLVEAIPTGPWRELHDFVRVDANGSVTRTFDVRSYSIEDELTVTVFAVIDSQFRELTVRTFHGRNYREEREEQVVFDGLRDVTDPGTQEFLLRALAGEEQRRKDQAAKARREGEQRVAAIPGSTEDPGLGKDYLRAQELLRNRVRSYGEARDARLLDLLGRFGALARPFSPALDLAVRSFVEGCRHAAFDAGVKATPAKKVPTLTNPPAELAELRDLLAVLHTVLLDDAAGQEHADAMSNAAAFERAAACVDRARKLLGD